LEGESARLELEGIGAFESGAQIRLPKRVIVKAMILRMPPPWDRFPANTLKLHLNRTRLRTQEVVQGRQLLLQARTSEPLGFFRLENQELSVATTSGSVELLPSPWMILRHDRPYVRVSTGQPVDIDFESPPAGAFVLLKEAKILLVRGFIPGRKNLSVRVGCCPPEWETAEAGSTFRAEVTVTPDLTSIRVEVRGPQESTTVYLLPIIGPTR